MAIKENLGYSDRSLINGARQYSQIKRIPMMNEVSESQVKQKKVQCKLTLSLPISLCISLSLYLSVCLMVLVLIGTWH